jgi:hypothetical protein
MFSRSDDIDISGLVENDNRKIIVMKYIDDDDDDDSKSK